MSGLFSLVIPTPAFFVIGPTILLLPTLFFLKLLFVLFLRPVVTTTIMISVIVIITIFIVPVVTNLLYFVLSYLIWQLLVTDHCPWTVIMVCAIPPIALKEVINTGNKY